MLNNRRYLSKYPVFHRLTFYRAPFKFIKIIMDEIDDSLRNNLVQVGTGEGKSLILGISSSVLALMGFEVSCACYSDYLSKRDYDSFLAIFESLCISKYIHYGAFNKICEKNNQ